MRRLLLILLFLCGGTQAQQPDFVVTLLGTGSPAPVMTRFGPGTLVQVGGQTLLFDAGRGVTQRLMQSRVRLGEADKLFITHLHSDHVVGIPDLWLTGWLEPTWAQRKGPFRVFGPAGTAGMMQGLQRAYDWDIKTRIADQDLKPESIAVETNHFVLLGTPAIPAMKEDEVLAMTRKTYDGPLVLGEDLMAFRISTTGVEIVRTPQSGK